MLVYQRVVHSNFNPFDDGSIKAHDVTDQCRLVCKTTMFLMKCFFHFPFPCGKGVSPCCLAISPIGKCDTFVSEKWSLDASSRLVVRQNCGILPDACTDFSSVSDPISETGTFRDSVPTFGWFESPGSHVCSDLFAEGCGKSC